jgi:hypothetical protein
MPASASNLPNHNGRKANSMSSWVRGIYNAAANFNLSNALRAASGRTMDRNASKLRNVGDEPNKCGKSSKSRKSSQSNDGHTCPCHCARTCNCISGECADNDGIDTCSNTIGTSIASSGNKNRNEVGNEIGKQAGIKARNESGSTCNCEGCREYIEYASAAAIRSEGQGAGSRIRFSAEPRNFKQPNPVSTDSIEYITGIHTGVIV